MKNIWRFVLLFCALAFCLAAVPASAALLKGHEEFMKNEYYKEAFEAFSEVMKEAKENFTPDEYKALEKKTDEAVSKYEKSALEVESELGAEVYGEIYNRMIDDFITEELRWNRLRKNSDGTQGFYRLKSNALEGYMAVEKAGGDDENAYGVEIRVWNDEQSVYFEGFGKLSDGKILAEYVYESDDEYVVTINFDDETAKAEANQAWKDRAKDDGDVPIDGEYLREK